MNVRLLANTVDSELLCAYAARICTDGEIEYEDMKEWTDEKVSRFLRRVIDSGHTSILEHMSFTFLIEGVSRALTHQLVRHRLASYTQESQRSVEPEGFVEPEMSEEARRVFEVSVALSESAYRKLIDLGVSKEDARYVLPEAMQTRIAVTMNARELLHFFSLRCCNRAQWEIRGVADRMLEECRRVCPVVFEKAGPPCEREGCHELKPCGKRVS